MSIVSISSIAVSGIDLARLRPTAADSNIGRVGSDAPSLPRVSADAEADGGVTGELYSVPETSDDEVTTDLVNDQQVSNDGQVNALLVVSTDDTLGGLLDLLA